MGPCAKQRVTCEIYLGPLEKAYGTASIVTENECANPQAVCPRAPGEDYTKCKTVCQQAGHAEQNAVQYVEHWRGTHPWLFGPQGVGIYAVITGHTYACQACQEALYAAGVDWIKVQKDRHEGTAK